MLSKTVPDDIRFLLVYGVPYWIEGERMLVGCSFFIKTPAPAAYVQRRLAPAAKHFNIVLKARQRHEMGFYGVRVWRTA